MYFTKIRDVKSPVRGHAVDAGIDFFVPNDFEETTVEIGGAILIPLGICVDIPNGYMGMFQDKSGVCTKRGLKIGAKIVDTGYSGEVNLHMFNIGTEPQVIKGGEKLAQMILVPISDSIPVELNADEYNENMAKYTRGTGGFGSTGA